MRNLLEEIKQIRGELEKVGKGIDDKEFGPISKEEWIELCNCLHSCGRTIKWMKNRADDSAKPEWRNEKPN